MSADSNDGFEYMPANAHTSKADRMHYWAVAIGLQAVDGLEVSPYLRELANDYEQGTYSLDQTGELIRGYHSMNESLTGSTNLSTADSDKHENTREADLVSQRIAELLAGAPFVLAPEILPQIHRYLFQDLDKNIYRPGEFKTERMIKQEKILNGDSVLYADPSVYDMSLRMAFSTEQTREYGCTLKGTQLEDFCHTIAFLWQIHPFAEGNTRTIAVFSGLYLNYLGFSVGNEPFELHSRYYRDALIRAMYRNAAADILPQNTYLMRFYDNVVNDAGHDLNQADLACSELFDHPELLRNVSPEEALVR